MNKTLDLAGEWVPTRLRDWCKRGDISHAAKAALPTTKLTFESNGKGKGVLGSLTVNWSVTTLAAGQYSGSASGSGFCLNDANLTILDDGTLQVKFPSQGIQEYWQRKDGRALEILHTAKAKAAVQREARASRESRQARPIKLVFRKIDALGIGWHWGLGIGESIYEVGGAMAVIGPRGVVHTTGAVLSAAAWTGTRLEQFHGYVAVEDQTSFRTDEEIEQFVKQWVIEHPVYVATGPNCQTFSEDLFIYLTGKNLEFSKFADLQRGPETHAHAVWLDPSKKPLISLPNAKDVAQIKGLFGNMAAGAVSALKGHLGHRG